MARLLPLLWPAGDGDPAAGKGAAQRSPSSACSDLFAKEAIVDCDICGQDVENSEELKKHMEQAHPTGVGDLETPDLLGDTPEESAASETRQPTH
jgi:hypothetical protein